MSGSDGELEVGEILGERKSSRRGLEYLVRWKDFGASNDTWEPLKNLSNAARAIADFHARTVSQKKTKRRSKSRSRSRSRSRTRSGSRSPARTSKTAKTKKTTTTTSTTSSPTKEQTKTETITRSPGRFEKTTETLTRSVLTPGSTQRSTYLTRSSEVKTTTSSREPVEPAQSAGCGWLRAFCSPVQKMKECCGGLVRSDYPAIVVFATIAIIFLSFVLERNVDFEKVWEAVVAFFTGIWAWLKQPFSK